MTDTIFALSSGAPPAAIAVIRVSGPDAGVAMRALLGQALSPRHASLRALKDPATGELLDNALCLWIPGPASATGEDMLEIHAHGGRAVVAGISKALGNLPGLRGAAPGEFTRRALEHGRIDLAEAEGLADLLASETENQRRQALAMASGALSRAVGGWNERLLAASAMVEARLDFSDEDDVIADDAAMGAATRACEELLAEWQVWLARPRAERLRDGLSVAVAGPPNAGKSTLINALSGRDVAITSPVAGTTRDVIEVPLALDGIAFRVADTAGLHGDSADPIEQEGMVRARRWLDGADIVLWLGDVIGKPERPRVIHVRTKVDLLDAAEVDGADYADVAISALTGAGMDRLHALIVHTAGQCLPGEGEVAMTERQWAALADATAILTDGQAQGDGDMLLLAERLRMARAELTRITGHMGTEAMLDALFGRFCIGK